MLVEISPQVKGLDLSGLEAFEAAGTRNMQNKKHVKIRGNRGDVVKSIWSKISLDIILPLK